MRTALATVLVAGVLLLVAGVATAGPLGDVFAPLVTVGLTVVRNAGLLVLGALLSYFVATWGARVLMRFFASGYWTSAGLDEARQRNLRIGYARARADWRSGVRDDEAF